MITSGSGYIKRQTAGSERFGGVTVTLTRGDGQRNVEATNWLNDDLITDDIGDLVHAAWAGIEAYSAENQIDLNRLNIKLSKFAYHPVDSRPNLFQKAAYHAFATAWQMRSG